MYYCEFPECCYSTNVRSEIEYHHIIPVAKNGTNKKLNRIWLCPNHHKLIYIPGEDKGIHSINNDNKIILLGWKLSTTGKILEYRNFKNEIMYYKKEKL